MQDKPIHIISFDNPFPPVYGGVIDVFFKIKALHGLGFKIYLHCFVSKVPVDYPELKKLCTQVYFYKSKASPLLFLSGLPFSVISRNSLELYANLQINSAPILFESLKTTLLIESLSLQNRQKILRLHNIEQDYFSGISKSERSLVRKISYYFEGLKYKKYEAVIRNFDKVLSISNFENDYINAKFNNSVYVPVFHGNEKVLNLDGFGQYAFYHGDLRTADNREAVRFLISAFKEIPDYKLVISSGSNEAFVAALIKNDENITFVPFNDFDQLKELMALAHINISWSFQKSGTKLKLINALFNGRFSIINENIVDDAVVAALCHFANDKEELIAKINALKNVPYNEYNNRKQVLENYLSDANNALHIDKLISQ